MPANIGDLRVLISANSSPMAAEMRKAKGHVDAFHSAIKPLAEFDLFAKTKEGVLDLAKQTAALGAGYLGVKSLINGLMQGHEMVEAAKKARIHFEVILGSAEKADRVLKEMSAFAQQMDVGGGSVRKAAQDLLLRGFDESDIKPMMRAMIDFGSATGDMEGALNHYIELFSVIKEMGPSERSIRTFAKEGIDVMKALSVQLGKTEADVKKLLEAGYIDSGTFLGAALQAMKERTEGMRDATADLSDRWWERQSRMGKRAWKDIYETAEKFRDNFSMAPPGSGLVEQMRAMKGGLKAYLGEQDAIKGMASVKQAVDPATVALSKFHEKVQQIIADLGKSDLEKELATLRKILKPDQFRQAEVYAKEVAALQERNKLLAEMAVLSKSLLNPQERFDAEMEHLNKLLDAAGGKWDMYTRAVEKAKKEMVDALLKLNPLQQEYDALVKSMEKELLIARSIAGIDAKIALMEKEHGPLSREQKDKLYKDDAEIERTKKYDELRKEANKAATEQLEPAEKLRKELERLDSAFKGRKFHSDFSPNEYRALAKKAIDEYGKTLPEPSEVHFASAAEMGSREAYSAIIRAQASQHDDPREQAKKQLAEAVEAKIQLVEANRKLANGNAFLEHLQRVRVMTMGGS
jgi:hypothetical protein